MKYLIMTMLTTYCVAYDCSGYVPKEGVSIPVEVYCRRILVVYMLDRYDRASIKIGERYSLHEKMTKEINDAIIEETEHCYETCLLANKKY